jgi:uncharacterized SAM-binding protein YcdF (DUF218 family)
MSFYLRRLRFAQRREIWCPTWLGSFCIALVLAVPVGWWFVYGEPFLSLTQRCPADVLVVEGWIGGAGVRAAAAEFKQGPYRYVVATGGVSTAMGWEEAGRSYAERAHDELIRSAVPEDRIILAPSVDTDNQRTYESAVAVRRALAFKGIQPKALNVFTRGPHARRSRLVFAKVLQTQVGVVGWKPPGYEAFPWWRSSERAREFLTETAGYVYEALLNSGRGFGGPPTIRSSSRAAAKGYGAARQATALGTTVPQGIWQGAPKLDGAKAAPWPESRS